MPLIEYESLSFKNAYIYRECEIPLANQGLVLVRGLNLDDGGFLGAGKSSLFEMFAQIQMGKGGKVDKRKGDKRAEMVNAFVGKDLSASLKLKVEGHPYEIRQYRDHYRYKNQLHVIDRVTGDDILPKGLGAYPHKWISSKLLQLDETSFFNLVYLVQELNNVMVHGSEADRRTRLTIMFLLDIYDELRKVAKKTLSLSKTALSDIEAYRHQPGVWDYLPKPCSENEILSTAQHAIDSVRRKPAGGNRRHHLLAAEDQSAAAEALQHHAASEGFDLDVVSAGAELLERAAHVRPDAMLLKDALPGVSGTVLFNIISRIPALNKTPIVLYASRQEMIADMPATPSPDGVCHRMASSDPREVIEVVAGLLRTPSDL